MKMLSDVSFLLIAETSIWFDEMLVQVCFVST